MRLGLLGYPIEHSLSPKLYQKLLGPELTSYDLFSFSDKKTAPTLDWFASRLDGLSITSPYKTHFISDVQIDSSLVRSIGAINTLAFTKKGVWGTNTDLLAIVDILKNYRNQFSDIHLLILGDGVMATVTKLVANDLNISFQQFSRRLTPDFSSLELKKFQKRDFQTIVINTCSRDYVCQLSFTGEEIFWDYNYSFSPHLKRLPTLVKSYQDGQEMLERQAKAAIEFWKRIRS